MKGKIKIGATISPLAEQQLEALVGSHQLFSSRSDAVEKAIGMMYYAAMHPALCLCGEECGLCLHGNNAGMVV